LTITEFTPVTNFSGTPVSSIPSPPNMTSFESSGDYTTIAQFSCDGPMRDGQLRYPYVPKTTRVASSAYPSWVAHVRGGMLSTSTRSTHMSGYVRLRLSFLDVTVETSKHVSTVPGASFMAL
jgi:hypothetical protein